MKPCIAFFMDVERSVCQMLFPQQKLSRLEYFPIGIMFTILLMVGQLGFQLPDSFFDT